MEIFGSTRLCVERPVIQHAKGTVDQQLMGPPKSAKITYQTPPFSIRL